MNRWRWVGWIVLVACSCKATDPGPICSCVDSNIDAPPVLCGPLMQTGCLAGEKCTWSWDQLPPPGQTTPPALGHIGCTIDGTLALGATCGPRELGGDPCMAGLACSGEQCKQICNPLGEPPGADCGQGQICAQHPDSFLRSGLIIAGVCEPSP